MYVRGDTAGRPWVRYSTILVEKYRSPKMPARWQEMPTSAFCISRATLSSGTDPTCSTDSLTPSVAANSRTSASVFPSPIILSFTGTSPASPRMALTAKPRS